MKKKFAFYRLGYNNEKNNMQIMFGNVVKVT